MTSRIRLASAISGPVPKKPREPSSPESEIPVIQASEPTIMTVAVTTAERLLPGAAMVPLIFLPLLFKEGIPSLKLAALKLAPLKLAPQILLELRRAARLRHRRAAWRSRDRPASRLRAGFP